MHQEKKRPSIACQLSDSHAKPTVYHQSGFRSVKPMSIGYLHFPVKKVAVSVCFSPKLF